MIRLLLVHHTRMNCELLATVLRGETDLEIVGYAHSSEEAVATIKKQSCDIILANINLPDNDAIRLVRALQQGNERAKVLITGLVKSNAAVLRCVEEGVAGYVLEEDSLADLVKKIRDVYESRFSVSPSIASALMARVAELKQMTKELCGISLSRADDLFTELTPREWEVLQLIEQGCNNQQIAEKLIIEKGTVKNHVHNILSKLDVHCREQAAMLARQIFAEQLTNAPVQPAPVRTFSLMDSREGVAHRGNGARRAAYS